MKKIMVDNNEYELIKDFKNGFEIEALMKRYTDYFEKYDYILGDWSYGTLRLKGFCEKENKIFNSLNDYSKIDKYIEESCAYGCKHFILKKTIVK